jgi:hypothetical protein
MRKSQRRHIPDQPTWLCIANEYCEFEGFISAFESTNEMLVPESLECIVILTMRRPAQQGKGKKTDVF